MIESAVVLTPLHYAYLIGVIVILAVMVLKKDTPAVCIAFLFILGLIGLKSVTGGIITVFSAVLYAGREFMEVLATIALVTSLSKCLKDLGSDYLMMVPMAGIMKTPSLTWWILGLTMFLFSLFLWPSPSVALVGAIMLPFAVKAGLNPLAAAMAMNLFGHGFALSYDVVIQGAPAISAGAAGLDTSSILRQAWPLFWMMGIVTVLSAYVLNRSQLDARGPRLSIQAEPSRPQGHKKAALFLACLYPDCLCRGYYPHAPVRPEGRGCHQHGLPAPLSLSPAWALCWALENSPWKRSRAMSLRFSLCHPHLCSGYYNRCLFLFRRGWNHLHHGGTV